MSFGKLVLFVFGIVLITLGLFSLYCANTLRDLNSKALATPQTLSVVDLVEKGPGNNLHVLLADFAFGAPIVDKKDGKWKGVWLPVLSSKAAKNAPPSAALWLARISNQQELDDYLKQTAPQVLVASKFDSRSMFFMRTGKTFQSAHPIEESSKLTVLTEPVFVLPNGDVIEAEILLGEYTTTIAWGAVAFSLIVGIFCLWNGLRSGRATKSNANARPTAPLPKEAYDKLEREQELSLHPFSWRLILHRAGNRAGFLLLYWGGALLFVFVGVSALKQGRVDYLVISLALSALLFLAGVYSTFMSGGTLFQGIDGFAVYPSGLRWTKADKTHAALWQDIAEVYRDDTIFFMNGVRQDRVSRMRLKLYDDQEIRLAADTYGDFDVLADAIQRGHQGWMAAVKRQALAKEGEAHFGAVVIRRDGLVLHGELYAWEDIEKYEIENAHINFFHIGAWFFPKTSIALSSIPNSLALLSILAEDLPQVIRGRRKALV
ncbi:MAG: hypothetical protein L0Y72_13610 [Gemmataceae bacterium]|nr:hypothetical protein [Gemmataceae bacterium]MCI0740077.1 hypothetical protein [Gemmataceae bacterium]